MMRTFFALVLLTMMLPAQAGEFWSKLWHNADQQGEALLQQGDASSAARVYADPRRKAYAKLKAGDYQGAAHDLDNLHDSDADYNRGNALAHAGKLQDALDAYDAALKSDPNNQDAVHNRELVANALKQQAPQQQKSADNKSQDDKKDGQQGKDSSGANNQDDKGKQGDQSGQDKNGQQGKSGQSDDKAGKGQDSAAQNKQEQQGKKGLKSRDGKQAGQGETGKNEQAQSSAKNSAQAGQTGEQARRDAEASLAKAAADGKNGEAAGDETNPGRAMPAPAPRSERQIAQEQWLRSIPDDPSGLLRRKFLIEHMMRQQKAQQ
jgi:Ca-activated chloride channel family protein